MLKRRLSGSGSELDRKSHISVHFACNGVGRSKPSSEEGVDMFQGEGSLRLPFASVLHLSQRCNAQRSDAQRKFFTTLSISLFLQRHRCDALPCFSASPVEIFYIAHIALRPLLPFFLSPQWFTVQNNKKFAKNYNAAMSPLATRDGQRNAQRTTQRCGALFMQIRRQ